MAHLVIALADHRLVADRVDPAGLHRLDRAAAFAGESFQGPAVIAVIELAKGRIVAHAGNRPLLGRRGRHHREGDQAARHHGRHNVNPPVGPRLMRNGGGCHGRTPRSKGLLSILPPFRPRRQKGGRRKKGGMMAEGGNMLSSPPSSFILHPSSFRLSPPSRYMFAKVPGHHGR